MMGARHIQEPQGRQRKNELGPDDEHPCAVSANQTSMRLVSLLVRIGLAGVEVCRMLRCERTDTIDVASGVYR